MTEIALTSVEGWSAFLRAGGSLSWTDYVELGPDARENLDVAGSEVAAEKAELVADALLRRLGLDEETVAQSLTDRAADDAFRRLGRAG